MTNSDPKRSELPIACSLPSLEQARRRETAAEILGQALQVEEIQDGYAFAFPGSAEWAVRVTEFVVFERACCPFFTFEIVFEPDMGPILLKVGKRTGGREGVYRGGFCGTPAGSTSTFSGAFFGLRSPLYCARI